MIHEKLLRDPIHDLITFDLDSQEDRLILRAIDTYEVQRLRRIRQLGMASMAFQGAEHSRFTHSIGVAHLVKRALIRLVPQAPVDPLFQVAARCAGLLHDIGHGPFSHVMENFFQEHHENWSIRLILDESTDIHKVLYDYSSDLPELVAKLLSGTAEPQWLNNLISSQMDADRFDYLIRDSHMTGVKYGIFDLERLLLLLRVSSDSKKIVVSSKGLLPVEKYLQSRYQMYRQVYFHKTVTSAEAMLMALLERARECAGKGDDLYLPDSSSLLKVLINEALTVEEFLYLDDAVLLAAMGSWRSHPDAILSDLSNRLLTRKLFKAVEVESEEKQDMIFDSRVHSARDFLEDVGLDFRYYLRFSTSSDAPYKPYSPSPKNARSTIWIQDANDGDKLHDVKDLSPTIKAFTESPYSIYRAFFPEEALGRHTRTEITKLLIGDEE